MEPRAGLGNHGRRPVVALEGYDVQVPRDEARLRLGVLRTCPARLVAASWRVEPTSVHTWPNKSGVLKSTRDAGVVKGAPRRRCRAAAAHTCRLRVRICWTAWRCGRRATTGGGCVCAAWRCGRRATVGGGGFVCLPLGCLALDFFLAILIRVLSHGGGAAMACGLCAGLFRGQWLRILCLLKPQAEFALLASALHR